MGFETMYLVRIAIAVAGLVAALLARRGRGASATGAAAIAWAAALLAVLGLLEGREAATYLLVAALGFGLDTRR